MKLNITILLCLIGLSGWSELNAQVPDTLAPANLPWGNTPPRRGAPPVRVIVFSDPTANKGKVEWGTNAIDFGTFEQGKPQTKIIQVKNISKEPLLFLETNSSCHCTKIEAPRTPVLPGESAALKFTYNAEDIGGFLRIVSIKTNFDPEHFFMFSVTGTVQPAE